MTNLWLNGNRLTRLVENLFNGMTSLKQVFLQDNVISDFQPNSLSGLTNVELLNLTGNRIPRLRLGVFDAVGMLQTLFVSHNGIRVVDSEPFQSQSRLVHLDLSDNLIETVTDDWFTKVSRPVLSSLS